MTIHDLIARKGDTVLSIDENATVFQAIEQMEFHRVGSILVSSGLDPVGIFTERDYLRRIVLRGRTSRTTLVREAMTADLITVPPDATVQDCMQLMTEHRIRHLPVVQKRRVLGMVSIGDLVKQLSEEAQEKARHLEQFVTGGYPG